MKMLKKSFLLLSIVVIALSSIAVMSGCSNNKVYDESIVITGDLACGVSFNSFKEVKNAKANKALLSDVLDTVDVLDEDGDIVIVGADGVSARTAMDFADKLTLYYDKEKKWSITTEDLPSPAKIKNIKEIILVATNSTDKVGGVIAPDEIVGGVSIPAEFIPLSYGNILFKGFELLAARSEKNGYYVEKYQEKSVVERINLADFAPLDYTETFVYSRDFGIFKMLDGDKGGYLTGTDGKVSYFSADGRIVCESVYGISTKTDSTLIDCFAKFEESIKRGKTMIIEIDGLFYNQYRGANVKLGGTLTKVLSVNPSISNVSLATILTGKSPKKTTIISRSSRDIASGVKTVFDIATENNRSVKYFEGNSNLINTSPAPELSIAGSDGTVDDTIYRKAMDEIANDTDFMFVHFHTVDDFNHNYSATSVKTAEQVNTILTYAKNLASEFDGEVYIVSDHGTYSYKEKGVDYGKHGIFMPSVMYLPFIKVK